jgi:hypothetical protein
MKAIKNFICLPLFILMLLFVFLASISALIARVITNISYNDMWEVNRKFIKYADKIIS